jgi:hypothetical protein
MAEEIRTYLVGRRNSSVACDIVLPESEVSVSRKHLELTVTAAGQCYLVHLHPKNTTRVLGRDGNWAPISQDYVGIDVPLLLGTYRTTARDLLALLPQGLSDAGEPSPEGRLDWDPERGTFIRR